MCCSRWLRPSLVSYPGSKARTIDPALEQWRQSHDPALSRNANGRGDLRENVRVHRDPLAINRAWWDGAAAIHGNDPIYDTRALIAGADSLCQEEETAIAGSVGTVDGLDVIHIQCHIGFDTISLARRGARSTGLDFSPVAPAKAEELATLAGAQVTWVQADAARIPSDLHGRFDLAYATIGAISWIEDLSAWMRSAAATLRPGGHVVLVEIHPLLNMVAEQEGFSLDFPYAFDGPHLFDEPGPTRNPVRSSHRARPSTLLTALARRSRPRLKLAYGSTRSPSTSTQAFRLARDWFRATLTDVTGSASRDSCFPSSSPCWRQSPISSEGVSRSCAGRCGLRRVCG
jgi:SAM-dependent methyltransferase